MKALVPSNHRIFEHALAEALAPLHQIDPVSIETVWHAWRCPASMLPFLACALSVDFWSDAWPEVEKRQVIADSPNYHRHKGTKQAVMDAAASSGRVPSITEWFQRIPEGRRGTATIHIAAPISEIAGITNTVRPRIYAAKPKSRAIFLGVGEVATAEWVAEAGVLIESLIIVEPYAFQVESPEGSFVAGFGLFLETLTTIEQSI